MRHRYQIINLHDRPLYPRPSFWSHSYAAPRNDGAKILGTLGLLLFLGTGVFVYTNFFRSTRPAAPILTPHGNWYDKRAEALRLVAPSAPAPDMDSPAIALANADVPKELVAHAKAMFAQPEPAAEPVATAAVEPARRVPKKHRIVRRLSPDAANSYASGFNVFRPPFGGW